jgi:hypothetical protein
MHVTFVAPLPKTISSNSHVTTPVLLAEVREWRLLVDTNNSDKVSTFAFGDTCEVTGRSFLAFLLEEQTPAHELLNLSRGLQI